MSSTKIIYSCQVTVCSEAELQSVLCLDSQVKHTHTTQTQTERMRIYTTSVFNYSVTHLILLGNIFPHTPLEGAEVGQP